MTENIGDSNGEDYAHLKNLNSSNKETVLVARALLPLDIEERTKLLWHDLQYTIVEDE